MINITPTIVHDVLGVPMGGNDVNKINKPSKRNAVILEWKRQFGCNPGRISVRQVIDKLKLQKDGRKFFKLNFLVVFNTIMGEITKSTAVNLRFLTSVRDETVIANMDWCSYIITCLKRTKEKWNGKESYNGPLTFLAVLYAHDQLLRHTPAKAKTPAIKYFTTKSLLELNSLLSENAHPRNKQLPNDADADEDADEDEDEDADADADEDADNEDDDDDDDEDEDEDEDDDDDDEDDDDEDEDEDEDDDVDDDDDDEDNEDEDNEDEDEDNEDEDGDEDEDYDDGDEDDVVLLDPKQLQCEPVENVSPVLNSVCILSTSLLCYISV
ncbi:putative acting on peptide bonds (peptidase) [Helianthus annuus]|nr:putative acting on peptide bonds (peptidase) [Helianthus annuus]